MERRVYVSVLIYKDSEWEWVGVCVCVQSTFNTIVNLIVKQYISQ